MSICCQNLRNEQLCCDIHVCIKEVYDLKQYEKKKYNMWVNGSNTSLKVVAPNNISLDEMSILCEHIMERIGKICEMDSNNIYISDI